MPNIMNLVQESSTKVHDTVSQQKKICKNHRKLAKKVLNMLKPLHIRLHFFLHLCTHEDLTKTLQKPTTTRWFN